MNQYNDPNLDLDAAVQAVSDITFHPTLLIGVGGTGAEVLRRVKRLYQSRSPLGAQLHRFVYIDTDTRTFLDRDGLPPVDPVEERCLIGVHQAEVYLNNKAHHEWITDRFPSDRLSDTFVRNLAQGQGAGQVRSVGALALVLDYQHVFEQITKAHASLTTMARTISARDVGGRGATINPQVVAYVVGSLAGGTGSGCFLDVAMIAQHVCNRPALIGMFALPDVFEQQLLTKDREQAMAVRANTYAALKELQYVLDADQSRTKPISFSYGAARSHVLEPSDRMFQLCYVVSGRNQRGGLSRPDELFELMARTIYQDTGSPFGTSKGVFDANCHVLTGAAVPCPKTKRPRLFSTVSTASLIFPALRIGHYCTYRTLVEVIHDRLLGRSVTQEDVSRMVTGFLAAEQLDDRGSTNQILDGLLTDPSSRTRLSADGLGLPHTHGQRLAPDKFVADMRAKWQRFVDGELPRVLRLVAENADRRLGQGRQPSDAPIGPAVEKFSAETAASQGVESVRDILDELQRVAQQMRREIDGEIQDWNGRERETFQQDFDHLCRSLSEMGMLSRRIFSKDDVLKRRIVTLFNDFIEGELLQASRSRAVAVINALESATAEQQKSWDALASRLRELKGRLSSAAKERETHSHGSVRGFVVERDATVSGYEAEYFDKHRLEVGEAFALIAEAAGGHRTLVDRLVAAVSMREVNDVLRDPIVKRYMQPLESTSVIDFVGDSLDERLHELLEMCQPFWNAEVPAVDIQFPEYVGVSATPAADQEHVVPPARLGAWAAASGHSYVVGHAPYEVVLSRRTYGARAAYLRSTVDWHAAYVQKRKDGRGHYMLQTHIAFEDLGDLE